MWIIQPFSADLERRSDINNLVALTFSPALSQSTPYSVASDHSIQSPDRAINTPPYPPLHQIQQNPNHHPNLENFAKNEDAQKDSFDATEPLVPKEDYVRVRVTPTSSVPSTRGKDLKKLELHYASSKEASKEKESLKSKSPHNKENEFANTGRGKNMNMKRLVYRDQLLEDGAEQQQLFTDSDSEETLDEITNTPSPSKRPKTGI